MDVASAYSRYFPALRHHCRRLSGGSHWSDDVAQDAFLRLLRGPRLSTDREVLAWLYRVSSNLIVDRLRQQARRPTVTEDLAPPRNATMEANAALSTALRRLADRLPPETLQAGLLSHGCGLTQPELAEVLRLSERTVRRRLAAFEEAASHLGQEANS